MIEATQEAICNSLFMAQTARHETEDGQTRAVEALPLADVRALLAAPRTD